MLTAASVSTRGGAGYADRMSMLLSSRFRRWLVLAIALPLGSWLLARIADQVATGRGEGKVTKALRAPEQWRNRKKAAA
jgi:hypothetical protein